MIYSYQRTKLAQDSQPMDFRLDTRPSSLITGQDLHYAKDQPDRRRRAKSKQI